MDSLRCPRDLGHVTFSLVDRLTVENTTQLIMAALHSRCEQYTFVLFLLLSSFSAQLISAAVDWMSTVLPHMVWP